MYSPENSPENQWLEDVFPIEIVFFRGHVSFRGCIINMFKKTCGGGGGNESQKHPSCNQAFTKAMDAEKQRLF